MHNCKVGKQTSYSSSYLHLLGAYMLSEAITLKRRVRQFLSKLHDFSCPSIHHYTRSSLSFKTAWKKLSYDLTV